MKQTLLKKFTIAAIALMAVPGFAVAQEKEKNKEKDKIKEEKIKDVKERQQIVITRTGDKDEKTVIEIDGDKVKVNGKDVADLKDIQVHVNNLNIPNMRFRTVPGQNNNFSMAFDDFGSGETLFKVDSNRAMLGVTTDGHDKGAEILSINKESAAEKAGLKKGDIIVKIDSRKIDGAEDVTDAIRAHKPGDKVSITYLRDSKENKATAELGRWKGIDVKKMTAPKILSDKAWKEDYFDNNNFAQGFSTNTPGVYTTSSSRPKLGLQVQDTDDGKGVKVLEVHDEGTASKAGIKEGDIITQIDDKAVNGADEISKVMKEKKDQPQVRFQVTRNGKQQTIDVKIPRKLKTVDM
jgi:serine protease Do